VPQSVDIKEITFHPAGLVAIDKSNSLNFETVHRSNIELQTITKWQLYKKTPKL